MHSSRSASDPAGAPFGSPAARPQLHGLDLIRGLAAIAVLLYHVDFMFGLRGQLLPGGYLAVDLFFILSGFVIAYNYEQALRSKRIGLAQLALRRFARLYPLYALMTVVGLFVMTARMHSLNGYYDTGRLALAALLNLLLVPTLNGPYDSQILFPFNAASWSIFYEVVVNVAFALSLAYLSTRTLLAAWIASGAALAGAVWWFGNVDLGWGAANLVPAFPRVMFSFITGMLIWRRFARARWVAPAWLLRLLLVAVLVLAQGKLWIPAGWQPAADMMAVFLLLPGLVIAGAGAALADREARLATFLGEASYAVYLTQGAAIIAAAGFTQYVFGTKIVEFAPLVGFVFVPTCIAASHLCYRIYEAPARSVFRSSVPRSRPLTFVDSRPPN